MTRQKKTRKVGPIGVRKENRAPKPKVQDTKKKKPKGKNPGNRNSELLKKAYSNSGGKQLHDSRLGSKKPIALIKQPDAKKFKTPQEELDYIENDPELQRLLDKEESGHPLTPQQQRLLDEKLSRHQFLCELLGISDEEDEDF